MTPIELPYPPSLNRTRKPWKEWTPNEVEFLRANYPVRGKAFVAKELGFSDARVRSKASALGIKQDMTSDFFRDWQQRAAQSKVGKKRPEQADVMRRAIHSKGLHIADEKRRHEQSEQAKRRIAERGHPRGMAGKKHSAETRMRLCATSTLRAATESDESKSSRTEKMLRTKAAKGTLAPHRNGVTWKGGWRDIGGVRKFYRSRWEANYARYLEWLRAKGEIVSWQHEPETFWFEKIKRGTRSYLPDFKVVEKNGSVAYHEVKGWMDERSATKLKRMAIHHPSVRMVVIRQREYQAIKRAVERLIEGWE